MLPFEIPVSWEWTHLGEITSYGVTGKADPSEVSEETWVLELEDIEKVSSRLLKSGALWSETLQEYQKSLLQRRYFIRKAAPISRQGSSR